MGLACWLVVLVLLPARAALGCFPGASTPIVELRLDRGGDGMPDLVGSAVRVSGWVTSVPGTFGEGSIFSIEDGSSGIFVVAESLRTGLETGSLVSVEGVVGWTEFGIPPEQPALPVAEEVFVVAGRLELMPCHWEDAALTVELEEVAALRPELLGRLVSLREVTVLGQPPQGFDSFLGIEVSGEGVALFIDSDTDLDGGRIESPVQTQRGLVFKMRDPADGRLKACVVPRSSDDIEGGLSSSQRNGWAGIKRLFR